LHFDELLSLLMLEGDTLLQRKEVDILDGLVVDFLDYVGLAAA
jgi:hypothetical protein